MADVTEAPFGSWASPLTAELIVQASVSLGGPAYAGGDLWWSELRPSEAGRVQLIRKRLDAEPGDVVEVLPDGCSARTRVHEYGGGAWWLHTTGPADERDEPGGDVTLFFANWADQRLYRIDHAGSPGHTQPVAITPEPAEKHGYRFADGVVTSDGRWTVCVREWHGAPGATEALNEIVAIPTDGSGEMVVLVGDGAAPDGEHVPDFVMSPRLNAPGDKLAWIQWFHPNMPWDETELWVGDVTWASRHPTVTSAVHIQQDERTHDPSEYAVLGGRAWMQPQWVDEVEQLWVVTDPIVSYRGTEADGTEFSDTEDFWTVVGFKYCDGRWNQVDGSIGTGDVGEPPWVFGQSSFAVTSVRAEGSSMRPHGWVGLAYVERREGREGLAYKHVDHGSGWRDLSFDSFGGLTALPGERVAAVAASFVAEPEIVSFSSPAEPHQAKEVLSEVTIHRPARDLGVDAAAWYSVPEHIEFSTTPNTDGSDATAYAFFYPPKNPDRRGPAGELPPLIVMSHGGPTGAARPMLQLGIQFWTSRGFAVADVNYRGSTGYGRRYRELLNGRWGIADVDDCVAVARFLAAEGKVDGERLAIRGGSAGGYTTLCALTFHPDAFTAGTSLYGIADLEALATDTHKFESRYLDNLVGPYPEDKATYIARSPIHHTDQLRTPLLILQGLEDEVVPPAQAEMMAAALAAKGVPYAYVPFEGEQHGFRQAPNIRRALEAELYFYSRMFGFDLADDIEPIEIHG